MRPEYLEEDDDIRYFALLSFLINQTWAVSVEALAAAQPGGLTVRLGREELVRGGPVLAVIPGASEKGFFIRAIINYSVSLYLLNLSCFLGNFFENSVSQRISLWSTLRNYSV